MGRRSGPACSTLCRRCCGAISARMISSGRPWRRCRSYSGRALTSRIFDTHKHTHLFPKVTRPLLHLAERCSIGAIRHPYEPEWSMRLHHGPLVRMLQMQVLERMRPSFNPAASTAPWRVLTPMERSAFRPPVTSIRLRYGRSGGHPAEPMVSSNFAAIRVITTGTWMRLLLGCGTLAIRNDELCSTLFLRSCGGPIRRR